jgi:hypothetical protein
VSKIQQGGEAFGHLRSFVYCSLVGIPVNESCISYTHSGNVGSLCVMWGPETTKSCAGVTAQSFSSRAPFYPTRLACRISWPTASNAREEGRDPAYRYRTVQEQPIRQRPGGINHLESSLLPHRRGGLACVVVTQRDQHRIQRQDAETIVLLPSNRLKRRETSLLVDRIHRDLRRAGGGKGRTVQQTPASFVEAVLIATAPVSAPQFSTPRTVYFL